MRDLGARVEDRDDPRDLRDAGPLAGWGMAVADAVTAAMGGATASDAQVPALGAAAPESGTARTAARGDAPPARAAGSGSGSHLERHVRGRDRLQPRADGARLLARRRDGRDRPGRPVARDAGRCGAGWPDRGRGRPAGARSEASEATPERGAVTRRRRRNGCGSRQKPRRRRSATSASSGAPATWFGSRLKASTAPSCVSRSTARR